MHAFTKEEASSFILDPDRRDFDGDPLLLPLSRNNTRTEPFPLRLPSEARNRLRAFPRGVLS